MWRVVSALSAHGLELNGGGGRSDGCWIGRTIIELWDDFNELHCLIRGVKQRDPYDNMMTVEDFQDERDWNIKTVILLKRERVKQ